MYLTKLVRNWGCFPLFSWVSQMWCNSHWSQKVSPCGHANVSVALSYECHRIKEFTTGAVFLNFLTCLVAIRHHWVGIQGMNTHIVEWSCIIRYIYLTSCVLKTCQSVEFPPNCWGCDSVILHQIDCTHFNFRDLNHLDFTSDILFVSYPVDIFVQW